MRTPGMSCTDEGSSRATLPPKTGAAMTAAYFMPGNDASMPNTAVPSTLAGMSLRTGEVPMRLNSALSFSAGLSGRAVFAAAPAKLA